MRNRSQFEDKVSQNKRLKESLYTLGEENDQLRGFSNQNQQMRFKIEQVKNAYERASRQNERLSQQNERLIREGNKWEQFADESVKRGRDADYQVMLGQLEQQVQAKTLDLKETVRKMNPCRYWSRFEGGFSFQSGLVALRSLSRQWKRFRHCRPCSSAIFPQNQYGL